MVIALYGHSGLKRYVRVSIVITRFRPLFFVGMKSTGIMFISLSANPKRFETKLLNSFFYACTVFLMAESPELHIMPGRADRYRMQTFRFE